MDFQLLSNDIENEITLTAFRLLTMDLLALFHIMNEGTINVLGEIQIYLMQYRLDCLPVVYRALF